MRGSIAKESITNKILEVFPGSFIIDKNIRIPFDEEGSLIQIKVTLTAAKDILSPEGEKVEKAEAETLNFEDKPSYVEPPVVQITANEKQNVADLLKALGL